MENYIELPYKGGIIRYEFGSTEIPGYYKVLIGGAYMRLRKTKEGEWKASQGDITPVNHSVAEIGEAIHRKLGIE